MANPLMSIFGSMSGGAGGGMTGGVGKILLQAFGSMLRGESPVDFLQNLARTNPALQGLDLTDINGTAERLCKENGKDANKMAAEITQTLSALTK